MQTGNHTEPASNSGGPNREKQHRGRSSLVTVAWRLGFTVEQDVLSLDLYQLERARPSRRRFAYCAASR